MQLKSIQLLLVLFVIASCSSKKNKTITDLEEMNLKGQVKSLQEQMYEGVEEAGRIMPGEAMSGLGSSAEYLFNPKGYLSFERQVISAVSTMEYRYEYDNADRLNKKVMMDDNDKVVQFWLYEYSDDGYLIKRVRYDDHSNKEMIMSQTQDEKGRVKQQFAKGITQNINQSWIYSYDNQGNLAHRFWIDSTKAYALKRDEKMSYNQEGDLMQKEFYIDGSLDFKVDYEYNDRGFVSKEVEKNVEGEVLATRIFRYSYDEKGNWLSKAVERDGDPITVTIRKITYY
ncbi:hypothetical protein GYB22_12605 [bacterium]|nr:hypothetical protein [bacterium]